MQTFRISLSRFSPVAVLRGTRVLRDGSWLALPGVAALVAIATLLSQCGFATLLNPLGGRTTYDVGLGALSWHVALLLVLAPIAEELVFRSGLQEQLLRMGSRPGVANLLTAGMFAIAHGLSRSWTLALFVFAPGCLLGAVYQQRREVLPCIAAHCSMNLIWFALSATSPIVLWAVNS